MGTTHLIVARVSPQTKARFRSLAEQQQMTRVGAAENTVSEGDRVGAGSSADKAAKLIAKGAAESEFAQGGT